jgi:class 3 adenylate cyclase
MSIRWKIILVVLPLFVVTVLLVGFTSAFSARAGITRLAIDALGFKAQQVSNYATNQWELLVENDLAGAEEFRSVTRRAIQSYAVTVIRNDSELIFAVDDTGTVEMTTAPGELPVGTEVEALRGEVGLQEGWQTLGVAGEQRVAQAFVFEPFGWFVLVSDTSGNFYREVAEINQNMYIILAGSLFAAVVFLLLFSSLLTAPLTRMVQTMITITQTNDLSERVEVEFRDEIGAMARTFNKMLAKLEIADKQIRGSALRAVMAQRNERRIRAVFQRYVPKNVIDTVLERPDLALVGQEMVLPVLFSDIRGFTTISEAYMPDELVTVLNRYFERLVDIISDHEGIVDKYIGDAIMAFFGAPVEDADRALHAVEAALEMEDAIADFNKKLLADGKPEFRTGIGIHYGVVTVGNIGTEKKMDYTVIGDTVNYGSRLEGLTKSYKQGLIVSKSVFWKVRETLPCRFIDYVQVKGKTTGEAIYTVSRKLTPAEKAGWRLYHDGIKLYYKRSFKKALRHFRASLEQLPGDYLCEVYIDRCRELIATPPPADWNGVDVKLSK